MKWYIAVLCALMSLAVGCVPAPGSRTGSGASGSSEQDRQQQTSKAPEQTTTKPTTQTTTETAAAAQPTTAQPEQNHGQDPDQGLEGQRQEQTGGGQLTLEDVETIQATITMDDGGEIVLELYPQIAPQSVYNFAYLARQGFYDGLTFHRIMKGFMIQGGDPEGTGSGGPGYTIVGEFSGNGFENDISHTRGVLSMARRADNFDSAGSQFFIVHEDSIFLDGGYATFGRVISGMDVVDRIAETPVLDSNGKVAEADKPIIKTITIDDDIELPMPTML